MLLVQQFRRSIVSATLILVALQIGCAPLQIPAIDPTGNSIFLPNSTRLLGGSNGTGGGCLSGTCNPLRQANPNAGIFQPAPFPTTPTAAPQYPVQPAYQHPADPPPCNEPGGCQKKFHSAKYLTPTTTGYKTPGENGQIIMTPARIVAPVGSEVVVLAGICGGDGYFVKNQPLEWMLSNNSVGEIIEVGGMEHSTFNSVVPPTSRKFDGQYAWGRTGLKKKILSRGTPTPVDDIELQQGQTFISVASASPGTTYVTGVAPKAEGWDRRRTSTTIHWVDGQWAIPVPSNATAGTVFPLTTIVSRVSDTGGVKDWIVRYKIVGGAPAEFAPAGSQSAETTTDNDGRAIAQLRQPAGQFAPGVTQVEVEIVRPPLFGEPELIVERGLTNVTWSAPALTIRAIGPKTAEVDQPFQYRIEVTNPGDQITRDVKVRTKNLDDAIEVISSDPKPTEYGRNFEWSLGDIPPGSPPRVIAVSMRSKKRGSVNMCFEVLSDADRLATEACAETEISARCISMTLEGPTSARVGDDVMFQLNVQNECDEPLEDILVTIGHDPGLLRPGKSNPATFKLPILQFGETRSLPISFIAQSPGTRCFDVEITAKGGHAPYRERRCVEVSNDGSGQTNNTSIDLEVTGGDPMVVGGASVVNVRVINRGDTPLDSAILTNRFSSSLEPTHVSQEFNSTMLGEELAISLGRINPGQTVDVRVQYQGNIIDQEATSEFTLTTPAGASANGQIKLRVDPAGPNSQPGFSAGQGGVSSGGPGSPSGGPIGIPQDPAGNQGNLSLGVRTLDRNIQMRRTLQPNPSMVRQSRIDFVVKNDRQTSIRDIDIVLLVQPGLKLIEFVHGDTNLTLDQRNDDFTKFWVQRCLELRPGEELRFAAICEGTQPGVATFEVQATSIDVAGTIAGRDTVNISQ